jgi:hypothetical protein
MRRSKSAFGLEGSTAVATHITPDNPFRPEDSTLEVRTGLAKPIEDVAVALRLGDEAR